MRVSPVGFAFNDAAMVLRAAMNSPKVSHSHAEGLIGASAVALAIALLGRHLMSKNTAEFFTTL